MIIKENQLFSMFDRMQNNYQPILLYGPNEGLIRENLLKIKGIFKTDSLEVALKIEETPPRKRQVFC